MANEKEIKTKDSGGSQTVRNMIIGVLTTVVVSACVYFLGFNKSSGPTKAEREKATVEAWKAYVTIENIAYRNALSIMADSKHFLRYTDMLQEILNESNKLQSAIISITDLDNVDNDLITLLKRRLDGEKRALPAAEKMFKDLDLMIDTALNQEWDEKKAVAKVQARFAEYVQLNRRTYDRLMNQVKELSGTLSRRYDAKFAVSDFYSYQQEVQKRDVFDILNEQPIDSSAANATPTYIQGTWLGRMTKSKITFGADGSFRWAPPTANIPEPMNITGNWKIASRILTINYKFATDSLGTNIQTGTWNYDFSNVTANTVCFQLRTAPFNYYVLDRE